jgi:hypothetical protein
LPRLFSPFTNGGDGLWLGKQRRIAVNLFSLSGSA